MKLKLLVAALFVVALALWFPMAATSSGPITFTSPAAGAALSGTQAYVISGTITPIPTLPDNVFIAVNPQGSNLVFDVQEVSLASNGTFSYSTNVGGNSGWTPGTYVITVFDSYANLGTTTFLYDMSTNTTSSSSSVTSSNSTTMRS